MRVLLSNLKDMVEAELAAKSGKKKKKKAGGKVGGDGRCACCLYAGVVVPPCLFITHACSTSQTHIMT
jgi:hypothetical protein